jgi:hypothetical protein
MADSPCQEKYESTYGLINNAHVVLDDDGGKVTDAGRTFLEGVGIDLAATSKRKVFCRPCLDWSERRPHLAGVVGGALLEHALSRGWVERLKDSRALTVTAAGHQGFAETFGLISES